MQSIPIPQTGPDFWEGTTGVTCHCGGTIEWAEAGFVPGSRACRRCLVLFAVRGEGATRRLVPQTDDPDDDIVVDATSDGDEPYLVPRNLYPGWAQDGEEVTP